MKFRNGFVSNSSSSSFIIGTNEKCLEQVLLNEFMNIYPAEGETYSLVAALKENVVDEILHYSDNDFKTWHNMQEVIGHIRNNWLTHTSEEELREELEPYQTFFSRWKFVHELTINDSGNGGSLLSSSMRSAFPRDFVNDNIEIKLDCAG